MSNPNPIGWIDRVKALADAHPDAPAELAGGLMPFVTVGDVSLAAPVGLDLDDAEIERVPGEPQAEFEVAQAAYRKLFRSGR